MTYPTLLLSYVHRVHTLEQCFGGIAEIWLDLSFPPTTSHEGSLIRWYSQFLRDSIHGLGLQERPPPAYERLIGRPPQDLLRRIGQVAMAVDTPSIYRQTMMETVSFMTILDHRQGFLKVLSESHIMAQSMETMRKLLSHSDDTASFGTVFNAIYWLWVSILEPADTVGYREPAIQAIEGGFYLVLAKGTLRIKREDNRGMRKVSCIERTDPRRAPLYPSTQSSTSTSKPC